MNYDWFWPRFENKSDLESLNASRSTDIIRIRESLKDINDATVLEEARRLYDQEQSRRDGADNKAGIYIAAVTALIAFFSSLMPKISNSFVDIILFMPFLLALIQLVRSGVWALKTLKVTKHYLLGWNDLIGNVGSSSSQYITENLLVALRANYDLNNEKITNLNMSHAALISASFWLLVFMTFKILISIYLSTLHGVFMQEFMGVIAHIFNFFVALITKSNLSVIGLTLDIIGVVLLWFFVAEINFADKKDYLEGNATLTVEDPTPEEIKSYKRKILITRIAMAMIVIGFILQFIGNYL
jgi:hypothetical protein